MSSLTKASVKVVKTPKKGWGVIALRDFKAGETVIVAKVEKLVLARDHYSIQTDWHKHAIFDKPAILLNHSCSPNLGLRDNQYGAFDYIALRAIKKGEELHWDYCMSEFISISIKECLCNSLHCRKRIDGYKNLPAVIKEKYKNYIAGYLKEDKLKQLT